MGCIIEPLLPSPGGAAHGSPPDRDAIYRPSPDRFAFPPLRGPRPGKHVLRHRKAVRRDYVTLMMGWNTEKVEG